MSSLTPKWTPEKIRPIIAALDAKTGLHGADLPIAMECYRRYLGFFRYEPMGFGFNPKFFNASCTDESEVIDVIRHEYAHYYVQATGLGRYFAIPGNVKHHGPDWKWACRMVGANPTRVHRDEDYEGLRLTPEQAQSLYRAEDVPSFDILGYMNRWDALPLKQTEYDRRDARLRSQLPAQQYFHVGDRVVCPQTGFGQVVDVRPNVSSQTLYVQFEDGTAARRRSNEVVKVAILI